MLDAGQRTCHLLCTFLWLPCECLSLFSILSKQRKDNNTGWGVCCGSGHYVFNNSYLNLWPSLVQTCYGAVQRQIGKISYAKLCVCVYQVWLQKMILCVSLVCPDYLQFFLDFCMYTNAKYKFQPWEVQRKFLHQIRLNCISHRQL